LTRAGGLMLRKRALLEEICLLTSAQSRLLAPEKAEELLVVVEKKQYLINEVNSIGAEVSRLEEEMKDVVELPPCGEIAETFRQKRAEIEEIRQEIFSILQKVAVIDEQNRRKANEEYRRLKGAIKSLRAGRCSLKAYQKPAFQPGGCFIDKKK